MSYYIGATGEYIWEELLENTTSNVVISNNINFDATPLTDAIQQTITDNLGTALGELIQTPTQVASSTGVGVISLTALGLLSYYKLNRTAVQDVDSMVYSADYSSILTPGMFDDRVRIRYDNNWFSNAFYYVGGIKKGELLTSRINLLPVDSNNIDIYTSTGKIGIGTATPVTPLHVYNATSANIRLETGATGTASIDFQRGTINDVNVDFRIINETGRFKLLSQDEVNLYTAPTSEIVRFTRTLFTNFKDLYNVGNIGIGTAPQVSTTAQLHIYNSTSPNIRLETDATGKASIEFQRGTINDANIDYRIINEGDLFKIQSQNATNLYTAGTMELIRISPTLTTNYKDFLNNGAFNNLGNVNISTTAGTSSYKLNVEGDVNIAGIGKKFYVNNTPVVSSQWNTSGTTIEYTTGSVGIGTDASIYKLNVYGSINANGLITSQAGITISTGQTLTLSGTANISANTMTASGLITANGGITTSATSLITANNGITIATGKTLTLSGTAGITAGGLITANGGITLATGQTLTLSGTAGITTGGLITANGGITIATGQTLTLSGTANISANTMTASGLITATGGITTGSTGTITANGGIIIPSGKYLSVGTTTTSDVDDNTSFAIPLATLYVKGGATTGGTCDVVIRGGVAGQNNGKAKLWLASDASHSSYIQSEHTGSGNTQLTFGVSSANALPTERMKMISDGTLYTANGVWHSSMEGSQRVYYAGSSTTYLRGHGATPFTFRNGADSDLGYINSSGAFYMYGGINVSNGANVSGDLAISSSRISLRGTSPTLYLRDTDNRSGMIHMNGNNMYFLNANGNDSENWAQQNNQDWALRINMDNNDAFFGGQITAYLIAVTNTNTDYVCVMLNYGYVGQGASLTLKVAYGSFTGFHRCYIDDVLYNNDTQENIDLFKTNYVGRVVIATGKIKTDFTRTTEAEGEAEIDGVSGLPREREKIDEWYSGIDKDGISIEDAIPVVALSRKKKDKRVFGVLGAPKRNTNNFNRLIVNSIGEGGICVSNTNGNIENGDYIQSSDLLGYGERQDDDLLHNYTIAKATIDCEFELNSPYYRCEEIENGVRVAFIACSYHCG